MDAHPQIVRNGKSALVEGPMVVFAEAETVAEVVGAAVALGDDVRGVDDGTAVAGAAGLAGRDGRMHPVQTSVMVWKDSTKAAHT